MGENPLSLATANDGEVHTPLQGNTSIGANEWMMMIDDLLDSGSDPIVRGMEADADSMLSRRRRVGDGPRAAPNPETEPGSCPPRPRPRALQKGSTFKSTIKLGGNASVNQGNRIKGTRGVDIEQEGSEFAGDIEASDGAKLTQGNEIDGEKVEDGGSR